MLLAVVSFIVLLAPVAHCRMLPKKPNSLSTRARPNIVLILADDLHNEFDMFKHLPNINEMKANGVEFPNHISNSPLCGPARASLLTGLLPHNHRYLSNDDPDAPKEFMKIQDKSVGQWLTMAGYYTAFLGKYVNALNHDKIPRGWRHWGGFFGPGTYQFYETTQWLTDFDEKGLFPTTEQTAKTWTDVHQADFLAMQTVDLAEKAAKGGQPFFIFTNPAMVHSGPCYGSDHPHADDDPYWEGITKGTVALSPCPKKREHNFFDTKMATYRFHSPNNPSWNTSIINGYSGKLSHSCCYEDQENQYPVVREKRTSSAYDLDDMVGAIVHGLRSKGLLDNTYVIFTSDNGFHLGEHKFAGGKKLPYQTDIRVPLVVRVPDGSDLQRGISKSLATSHIDVTRTIVELASADEHVYPALENLDGNSFASALAGGQPKWPRYSYSEMFEDKDRTWRAIQYVNDAGEVSFTFHVWCNGQTEVFEMDNGDTEQLKNVVNRTYFGKQILSEWLPVINGMGTCSGSACSQKDVVKKPFYGDLKQIMTCRTWSGDGEQ